MKSSWGLVIGAGFGLLIGVALGNAGIGLIFGAGVGLVLGPAFASHSGIDTKHH
jgi:hypothetical protein